jgi:hypothetical protein
MATESPTSLNAQDFSGSDDEILDNFAEGPLPDGADPNDDGTPMGVGGEKGKQSEPANSTLEADIVNGTQPGEEHPPEDTAASEPVQEEGEKGSEDIPEPAEEPETPDFPPALLQMAGLADAESAQASGFKDPEALYAALKWRSQLFSEQKFAPSAPPSPVGLYKRPADAPASTAQPAQEPSPEGGVQPFQLPPEKMALLDEDLQDVIRQMNDHYQQANDRHQKEVESLRSTLSQRDAELELQKSQDESMQFDSALQGLGEDWKDVFGEGDGSRLALAGQSDPVAMTNFNHRALLYDAVLAIREVNEKQGYKPMTLEQEIHWALLQRYPDKFQQAISKNSNGSGPRPGVTASRPTQRKTPPKSQNEKVLSSVDAMLRKKHGYGLDMGNEDEFDGEI